MAGSNRGRVKRSGNQRLFGRKPLPVTMPRIIIAAHRVNKGELPNLERRTDVLGGNETSTADAMLR